MILFDSVDCREYHLYLHDAGRLHGARQHLYWAVCHAHVHAAHMVHAALAALRMRHSCLIGPLFISQEHKNEAARDLKLQPGFVALLSAA